MVRAMHNGQLSILIILLHQFDTYMALSGQILYICLTFSTASQRLTMQDRALRSPKRTDRF